MNMTLVFNNGTVWCDDDDEHPNCLPDFLEHMKVVHDCDEKELGRLAEWYSSNLVRWMNGPDYYC